ncbi:MAG: ABC transporter ATP-binding protein [Pseudomonadales bacterium]|nr:ABC transporter ATP-binding protein [Pseudomonadales bacterium]
MIDVRHISKSFGKQQVINDISLGINQGEIFGLLGPNASGKTTLIRLLCGLIDKDAGEVFINKKSIREAKKEFGYVAQHFGQYEELTVLENISFYAKLYGVNDRQIYLDLLKRYDLEKFLDRKAGALSGGYQRRLALTCALVHDPLVLFLDEPTAGIDPVTRKTMWDDLYQLSAQGKTLLVTTHYMEEAQRCHRLAFITSGSVTTQGTPESVLDALGDARVYTTPMRYDPKIHELLYKQEGVILVNQFGSELRIIAKPSLEKVYIQNLISAQCGFECQLVFTKANLEDVFIAINRL